MKQWIRRLRAADDGMTLTEMLVVLVLLGVVLATAYTAQQAIQKSNDLAESRAVLTQQVTYPMLLLEKIVVQNRKIDEAGFYVLKCETDKNLDGVYERNTIRATPEGRITLLVELLNNDGSVQSVASNTVIGYNNANDSAGVPLFRFFDVNGIELDPITDSDVLPDTARSVSLTIRATNGGASLEESRTIQFRNRD